MRTPLVTGVSHRRGLGFIIAERLLTDSVQVELLPSHRTFDSHLSLVSFIVIL